jgi:hypothetical protein
MLNIYSFPIWGGIPGDPELGGWRPLPITHFKKHPALNGLWRALQFLGFELKNRELKRAMEIIANKLKQTI